MTRKEIEDLFEGNKEQYEDFQQKFNRAKDVINLKQQIANLQRSYRYVQAMQLQKKLNDIEYKIAKDLIKEAKSKVEHVSLLSVGLSKKEQDLICDYRICLDILANCMETYVMEMDEILKRHDKTLAFEDYIPTVKMLKEARRHLDWCSDNTDYRQYEPWGDECDKLIKTIYNKAKAIKRETKKAAAYKEKETEVSNVKGKEKKDGEQKN